MRNKIITMMFNQENENVTQHKTLKHAGYKS